METDAWSGSAAEEWHTVPAALLGLKAPSFKNLEWEGKGKKIHWYRSPLLALQACRRKG